jgi:hypothetical protein
MFGKKRPDASKRMTENNPNAGRKGKDSPYYGTIVVKDANGKRFRAKKDDPRLASGEIQPVNKGMVAVRDKDGHSFQVAKDDPRLLSGELESVFKGVKRDPQTQETKEKRAQSLKGKKRIEEQKKRMSEAQKKRTTWPSLSEEHKQKLREQKQGQPKEKVECPHCHKTGGLPAMKRFHFDNCKEAI